MFGQLFTHSPLLLFPLVALSCSLVAFLAIVLHASFGSRERNHALAKLPLSKDGGRHG